MHVKKFSDAQAYEAPNHFDVKSLRIQGFEDGAPKNFWVGISHLLPGGGAGPDASPLEKVYVVLAGHVKVIADGKEHTLGPLDSVCIPENLQRIVVNPQNEIATMLVVMPYPAK